MIFTYYLPTPQKKCLLAPSLNTYSSFCLGSISFDLLFNGNDKRDYTIGTMVTHIIVLTLIEGLKNILKTKLMIGFEM